MKYAIIRAVLLLGVITMGGALTAQTYPMGQQDPAASGFTASAPFGTVDLNIGWRFKVNTDDVIVTQLGCNYPAGAPGVTVTLFDVATQSVLAQEVCGPGTGWQFVTLANPVALNNGSEYVIASLLLGSIGPYFHSTPPASWVPTGDIELLDNQYALSGSANDFPATSLGAAQYGVVDFGYADTLVITAPGQAPNAGELTTYNETFSATNGAPPYSWALASGTLPSGLNLATSGDDYVLSGTPATGSAGNYSFDIQVTDSTSATDTKTINLTVDGVTITSSQAPEGIAGTVYSEDIQAIHGQTPYTWALQSGTLPSGLTINQVGDSFRISGTPDLGSNGLYTFDVQVTDSLNATASETISLFIKWPAGTDIYPMTQQDPTADGFGTFTYLAGYYVKWGWKFKVNSSGISVLRLGADFISNSPVTVVIFDVVTQSIVTQAVVTQPSAGGWGFENLPTPVPLQNGKEYVICGHQSVDTASYWHTNLPASWKPTGDIEWQVGVNESYNMVPPANDYPTNTITNRMGGVVDFGYSKVLSVATDETLPAATEQVAYSEDIQATAGQTPYTWSLESGALPTGLNLSQVGDVFRLSGTPATGTPGSYTFTVKVTDNLGYVATKTMQLPVAWPASHYTYPMNQQDPSTTGFTTVNSTSSTKYQWGWRFRANSPGLSILRLGSNYPNQATTPHIVTLFDATTQAILAQETVPAGTGWQFTELFTPVVLTQGAEYIIVGFSTANYYYDTSLATSWKPTGDIEYIHGKGRGSSSLTENDFPTNTYSNRLYGVVDFGYAKSLTIVTDGTLPSAAEQSTYSTDITADFGSTPYNWTLVSGTIPNGLNLVQSGNDFRLSGTPATGTMGTHTFTVRVQDSLNKTLTKVMTLNILQQSTAIPFSDDFSSDLGWQYGTDWSRGSAVAYSATGPTRSEPASDYSSSADNNIAGHRIGADYDANMGVTDWLTSPPFNCNGATIVSLRYYRWLGSSLGDTTKVQVTNNGIDWHDVWVAPTSSNINDKAWTLLAHDISQWAAGNSVVQVRFGVGPTQGLPNTGWCIDDVLIFEPPPELEVREGGLTGTIITDNEAVGGLRDFGLINPSTNSPILTIGLTNNGLNTINFNTWSKTGANPGDFYVLQNPPASLAPNASATMQIQFYSTVVGIKTATLSLPHDAVGSGTTPFEINLRAECVVLSPNIQVDETVSGGTNIPHQSPATGTIRDFGSVLVGSVSGSITIAITNTGNGPMVVQGIDMGGTWWNQFAVNTGPIPPSIAAGSDMTFTVAFQPTTAGLKDAYVRIYHDDGTQPSPYHVPVLGDATPANPRIEVSDGTSIAHNDPATGARDFGAIIVASTSAPATITVSNNGGAALTVGTPTLGGPDASQFVLNTTAFASSIGVGNNSSFEIRFAPTSVGQKVATVSFTHNDTTVPTPFIINVTGNGVLAAPVIEVRETNIGGTLLPNPAPSAGILDFGSQDISAGPTALAVVFVENTGTAILTLGTPVLQGSGQGEFVLNTASFPGSLAIGASASFSIAFNPSQPGTANATVEFSHNDGTTGNPYVLNVTGDGAAPVVEVREGSATGTVVASGATALPGGGRDCGTIDISAGATAPITIVIRNAGAVALNVGMPTLSGVNSADFGINTAGMTATVAPGSSTSFAITFDPTLGGIKDASVVFTHDDPVNPSPFVVPVIGTGFDPSGIVLSNPSNLPAAILDSYYGPVQLISSGGVGTHTWSLYSGSLPHGLTLSPNGVLSGTPRLDPATGLYAGDFTFRVRATDTVGGTGEQALTISVLGAPGARSPNSAGCSSRTGGSTLIFGLLALSLLVGFRRRKTA